MMKHEIDESTRIRRSLCEVNVEEAVLTAVGEDVENQRWMANPNPAE
jgi:hypothetical protein